MRPRDFTRHYSRQDVLGLFRFIDWLLQLPEALDNEFWQTIEQYEAEKNMPYITSVERIGIQKGAEKTWREAIAKTLASRFGGTETQPLADSLARIDDPEALKSLFDQALSIDSLSSFEQIVAATLSE